MKEQRRLRVNGLGFFSKCVQLNKQTKKTEEFEEIPPTFCHGTKVKPWKFEKKLPKLSFVWREGGRKEEKSLTNKQTKEIWKSKENSLTNKQAKIGEKWRKTGVFSGFLKSVPYRSN